MSDDLAWAGMFSLTFIIFSLLLSFVWTISLLEACGP